MNSSIATFMIIIIALVMLLVYPIQSMSTNDDSGKLPMRHKRWTFNTWRLHGRRQLFNNLYSPKAFPADGDHQYEVFNNDDSDAPKTHERLSQLFQELYRK